MSKTAEQVKPNYAPIYAAALYPELSKIFVTNGYALAVHGSLARDMDLIAVPWAKKVSKPSKLLKEITTTFSARIIGKPTKKNHKRIAHTLSIGFGQCSIDLSFLPTY